MSKTKQHIYFAAKFMLSDADQDTWQGGSNPDDIYIRFQLSEFEKRKNYFK